MGLEIIRSEKIKLPKDVDLYRQTYERPTPIKDVAVIKLGVFSDDYGGWFKEALRLDDQAQVISLKEQGIEFSPVQVNMVNLAPGTKRFWHIHLEQNEIWTPSGTLLIGLIDYRDGSPTYGQKTKVILTPDKALYIPSGVAHGFINPTPGYVTLNYFTDKFFVGDETTQECRIDPADVPFDFVGSELI